MFGCQTFKNQHILSKPRPLACLLPCPTLFSDRRKEGTTWESARSHLPKSKHILLIWGENGGVGQYGTQDPGIRLFTESCCQPSPAFLTRSPEVSTRCLAATTEGQIPFQSCCRKKGLLFVTAAYLMVTTSPVFSRLHTSSTAGNENLIPYFLVALLVGVCAIATMCPKSCRIIQN